MHCFILSKVHVNSLRVQNILKSTCIRKYTGCKLHQKYPVQWPGQQFSACRNHHLYFHCLPASQNAVIFPYNLYVYNPYQTHINHSKWMRKQCLHLSATHWDEQQSKVEQTVKALKEKIQEESTQLAPPSVTKVPEVVVKKSLLQRFIDELKHYYHGFRLLFIDIKVCCRLLFRVLNGHTLSRRERKQLVRTTSDLFRLLPFLVFIIVPFMEFLLPVALKLFPGMLPSTFQEDSKRDEKLKKELKVKLEMAKFLQDTVEDMAVLSKTTEKSNKVEDFAKFFEKIRTSGEQASNEEILKFSKLFEDELTLDNLTRPQLVALCRLLELQPIGTDNLLRFQLRMKLRELKADDKMIQKEGIESLNITELQAACRARGMRALGVPLERLKSQLMQWLELSLNECIPPSLLLLSRALYVSEQLSATDQLKVTLQTLPPAMAEEAMVKLAEVEGTKVDNKAKLEVIKQEEAAIRKEEELKKKEEAEQKIKEDAAAIVAPEEAVDKETIVDKAPIIEMKPEELLKTDEKKKEEDITKEDLEEIEVALESISKEKKSLLLEKEELKDLKEDMTEYKEDVEELKGVVVLAGGSPKDITESKAAQHLSKQVNRIINRMDQIVGEMHDEKSKLQDEITEKTKVMQSIEASETGEILQKEMKTIIAETKDNIISINELVLAMKRLQKIPDDTKLQRINEVLQSIDTDQDGNIHIDHVIEVIELIGQENVKISPTLMKEIVSLLTKEEEIELEEKREKLEKKEQQEQLEQKK